MSFAKELIRKKKNIGLIILLNIAVLIIAALVFKLRYETNDDIGMAQIAAGKYEQEYLLYINILYGLLLKQFYLISNAINWYGWFLYGMVFISLTIIAVSIISQEERDKTLSWGISILFFLSFGLDIYANMQFTKAAVIIMVAGVLLIEKYIEKNPKSISSLLTGSFLFLWGSLIRYKCVYIIYPFIFVMIMRQIYITYRHKNEKKMSSVIRKHYFAKLGTYSVLIIIAASLNLYNSYYYNSDPIYKDYIENRAVREKILDFSHPQYSQYPEEYDKIGLKEVDLAVLGKWNIADPDKFDYDTLSKIKEIQQLPQKNISTVIMEMKDTILLRIRKFNYSVTVSFILIIIYLLRAKKEKSIFLLEAFMYLLGLYFILVYGGRVVYRVEYGIWLCFMILILQNINQTKAALNKRKVFLAVCIFISFFMNYGMVLDKHFADAARYGMSVKEVYKYTESHQENIYFYTLFSLSTPHVEYSPFEVLVPKEDQNLIALGGWDYKSKLQQMIWDKYNIKNPFIDLVIKQNAYLIDSNSVEVIQKYIQENYYPNVKFTKVDKVAHVNVYKFYLCDE